MRSEPMVHDNDGGSRQHQRRADPRWFTRWPLAVFVAAYLLAGGVGQGLAIIPGVSITFWPPAGIFVASLLLARRAEWPLYVFAACVAELTCNAIWFHNPLHLALVYFAANALVALIAATLLTTFVSQPFRFQTIKEVGAFVVLGSMVAPLASATVIATTDAIIGKHRFSEAWPLVWLGDGAGLLVSAPLTIAAVWAWRERATIPRARVFEAVVVLVLLVAAAFLAFVNALPTPYVTMPPLLWMAARFQLRGAAAGVALTAIIEAALTVTHADVPRSAEARIIELQTFLGVSSASALFVAALSQQRQDVLARLAQTNEELELRVAERTATLRESEERLRLFIEHAPAAVAMFNRDMRCLAVSRRWLQRYRISVGAAGLTRDLFLPAMPDRWKDVHQRVLAGAIELSNEDPFEREDGSRGWERWEARPWRHANGNIGGVVIFTEDITDRKLVEDELQQLVSQRTRELEESHQRLRLSERMASIGTLSAGLGHDMGNLLLPMRVRLESLKAMSPPGPAHQEIDGIRSSMEYLRRLASGLRLLALDPGQTRGLPTQLGEWWTEAEAVFRNALPRGVTLESSLGDTASASVSMSRAALTQAVFNLVQNAGDAMKGRPHGVVSVSASRDRSAIRIVVRDTGPGMSDEVRRRCMEPFFTTKTRGVSTGLGLALVYGLVREAGGSIELDSEPGKGAAFTLLLPEALLPTAGSPLENGRRAVLDIPDARVRGYVAAELRNLMFDVVLAPVEARDGDLLVVVGPCEPRPAARVVVLSGLSKMSEMRAALHAAIKADAPSASRQS